MALVVKDRVKETTTTTGTGTYTLGGAVTGFETFTSNLSNADTTYYVCTDGTDFEVGIGTFTSSGTTLARTTILASSNSNNAVNWTSGTREIFITYPADKSVFLDASGNLTLGADLSVGDDLALASDGAIITFGADADINLTHVADTGLTTNGDFTVGDDLTVSGGQIDLKTNSGAVAKLLFYCESGNAHAQTLQAQPHSAGASDVLTLPTGGNSTLVSRVSTDTLTNKTLTTPTINGATFGSADLATASNGDINLAPNGTGKVVIKGNTNQGKIVLNCENNSHGQTIISAPHSESANNVLTLPSTGGDARLVSTASTATLTNKTFGDNVSFGDNNITNVGDIALDSISADGTDINVAVSDNSATAFTIKQGSDNYFVVDTGNSSESIAIGTGVSGTAITLGHSTSEVTVADNLTVTGDLTVSGTTTTVNSTTVNLNDHNIVLDSGNSTSAVINGAGITIEGGTGTDASFLYSTSGPKFELKLGSDYEDLQVDQLIAASLDISGNVDVDGTLEADAITVDGTALNTVIAGVTVTNATNATNATHVSVADNESTNEDNLIPFIEDTSATGNVGLESDGDFHYNPSTGRLTATQLSGTLQTAAQANITSLGTLTTLTVDNVIINGSTIGHTGDTDLMTVASGVLTVAGEVDATSLDISGDADIDGTLEADAITVNGTALNTVIADEATALAIALG
tara:strand:- start:50 stop:2128 length:2079 start_codon:yes stop_codon:yes gene_type:complete